MFYSAALETNLYTATDAAETDDKLYKLRDETTNRVKQGNVTPMTDMPTQQQDCKQPVNVSSNNCELTHSAAAAAAGDNRPTVQCQLDRPSTDCGPVTHPPLHPGIELSPSLAWQPAHQPDTTQLTHICSQ